MSNLLAHFACSDDPWTGICGFKMTPETHSEFGLPNVPEEMKCQDCARILAGADKCPGCGRELKNDDNRTYRDRQ